MTEQYDSRPETLAHIDRVRELMAQATGNLKCRAAVHDASKLAEPELSIFDRMTPKLRTLTYGTPEYAEGLKELGVALDHHYAHNDHHPQHYPPLPDTDEMTRLRQGIARREAILSDTTNIEMRFALPRFIAEAKKELAPLEWERGSFSQMSLLSLLEMLCDWKAAGERHANGSMQQSLDVNKDRFGLSPQLHRILENTAKELGWL